MKAIIIKGVEMPEKNGVLDVRIYGNGEVLLPAHMGECATAKAEEVEIDQEEQKMKEYKYRGYTFRRTSTTTEVTIGAGTLHPRQEIRYLYEIYGLKECGKRPFLTSVNECREYIRDATD